MKIQCTPSVIFSRPKEKLSFYLDAEDSRFDKLVYEVALLIGGSYFRALKKVVVEGDYVFDHAFEGCLVSLLPLTIVFDLSVLSLGLFLNGGHSGLNLLLMISQL